MLILSAVAVAGTGTAVGGGVVLHHHAGQSTEAVDLTPVAIPTSARLRPQTAGSSAAGSGAAGSHAALGRHESLSRSADRTQIDPAKQASLGALAGHDSSALAKTEDLTVADPKAIAEAMMAQYGWDGAQFTCLVSLWTKESNWNVHAENPSGAYGIPQALPGSKMASAGSDWEDSAETQIKWGLGYIQERYGTPCGAWDHSEADGWY